MANPRVFISYAHENEGYGAWVEALAARLREDGVDARLDRWHLRGGVTLVEFMNREIRQAERVLILCSPAYRARVHAMEDGESVHGSGWEHMLVNAQIFAGVGREKLVAALTQGSWFTSAPSVLLGLPYFDLSMPESFESTYTELLRRLVGLDIPPPPIGQPPRDLIPETIRPLRVPHAQQRSGRRLRRACRAYAIADAMNPLRGREYAATDLAKLAKRWRSTGEPISIIVFDLDDFTVINDHFSSRVGEEILGVVDRIIHEGLDLVVPAARLGQDSFFVVLPGVDQAGAERFGEQLRKRVECYRWSDIAIDLRVSASFGVSEFVEHETSLEWTVRALLGVRLAKAEGRNRVSPGPLALATNQVLTLEYFDSGKWEVYPLLSAKEMRLLRKNSKQIIRSSAQRTEFERLDEKLRYLCVKDGGSRAQITMSELRDLVVEGDAELLELGAQIYSQCCEEAPRSSELDLIAGLYAMGRQLHHLMSRR